MKYTLVKNELSQEKFLVGENYICILSILIWALSVYYTAKLLL